jgi:hypothetical protein
MRVYPRHNFVYVSYHSPLKACHGVAEEILMFSSAFQLDTDSLVALGWVGVGFLIVKFRAMFAPKVDGLAWVLEHGLFSFNRIWTRVGNESGQLGLQPAFPAAFHASLVPDLLAVVLDKADNSR